jgi:hypothetical protein
MSDDGSPDEVSGYRAPEIVSLLGGPVFVDMRPGHVRVICEGVTGVGADRKSAFRALAELARAVPTS